ncbi:hypothetical protein BCR34DRAFT_598402 [Clohesyomyces aquaticus]|uniref:Uncharacterized protein n=1 Tax=Clohesyomyces aquaticus TaxID=1231657 RepID=A0A1Y1ZYX5_9PLEO|nr:hypothetical protein BCR34DRAFT_598402 [Clohesyomyces aquaticus]
MDTSQDNASPPRNLNEHDDTDLSRRSSLKGIWRHILQGYSITSLARFILIQAIITLFSSTLDRALLSTFVHIRTITWVITSLMIYIIAVIGGIFVSLFQSIFEVETTPSMVPGILVMLSFPTFLCVVRFLEWASARSAQQIVEDNDEDRWNQWDTWLQDCGIPAGLDEYFEKVWV